MQIPLVNGIYTQGAEYRTALPRNWLPVPKQTGISEGYLRPAYGLKQFAVGAGPDRGGINWKGDCYRVSGTKLIRVFAGGTTQVIGEVGSGAQVSLDYSFDVLGIVSGGRLYYYDGAQITPLTDSDAGNVVDALWISGYWLLTDGTSLIVTELNDRYSISPLKYGSAETDPDPILRVLKLRNEPHAIGRYSIEVFENVGGDNFPFQRIPGAYIEKGAIGTHMACLYAGTIAFVGSGRDEGPGAYLIGNGVAQAISTREIETILQGYTESQLAQCKLEAVANRKTQHLMLHLPDRCLVYDAAASQALELPVWFQLDSGNASPSQYRARDFVWCYDKWIFGDPTSSTIGTISETDGDCYGVPVGWEFISPILYNESKGAIVNGCELVALTGRGSVDAQIYTSSSNDGITFSPERGISSGAPGQTLKRLQWRRLGHMRQTRIQKFRSDSRAFLSISALEAELEPLAW